MSDFQSPHPSQTTETAHLNIGDKADRNIRYRLVPPNAKIRQD